MLFRLPSIEAWPVVFFHDPSQEKLVYIGETVTHPKKPSNTGFSPGRLCRGTQTQKTRIKKARLKSQSGSVSTEETPPEDSVSNPPFLFTPSINFISESHAVPARVFSPKQPPAAGKEPLSTLAVSEGQQLRDALFQSIFKCMQVQNSLYRLVLVKLQGHVKASQTDLQRSYASDSLKATSAVEAAEIINDGPSNHHAEDTTESRLDDVPKVPAMENAEGSLDDIPEASSVNRTGESLKCVPDAPETPKDLSRQSSGETPIDATEATNGDSTGKCQNDVAKVTATEDNLHEFPKAPIEECTAKCPEGSRNLGTPSTGGPEVNLNDAPEASGILGTPSMGGTEVNLNDALEASSSKVDGPSDVTSTLLCEIKNPLETLVRCTDIQRTLLQRLVSLNLISAPEVATDSSELQSKEKVDMMAVQSKLDEVTFKCKTRMECNYARNPFSNQPLEPSTNIDVLHVPFVGVSEEIVPHGRGTLETTTGDFIYRGDWCRGKRHGKGEGLIFSRFAPQHGFYTGGWKHNMRHGHGKMIFSSGAVYEGQWQFDEMTGYGTLKHPDGTIRAGTWKDGSLHGCAVFTWPHGVAEYREYDASRGQLSSCAIEREATEKLSRLSSLQSQLLNLQGCVTELRDEKRFIAEQLNTLNTEHAEIRKTYEEQWERVTQKHIEELLNAGKAAEEAQSKSAEEIAKLKKELEESKGALMCQICFTRPRDCIILPCSHLLYCRVCVHEHKSKGDSRCPTCRGTINSEILCNVNLPS